MLECFWLKSKTGVPRKNLGAEKRSDQPNPHKAFSPSRSQATLVASAPTTVPTVIFLFTHAEQLIYAYLLVALRDSLMYLFK